MLLKKDFPGGHETAGHDKETERVDRRQAVPGSK
jgi:hypothetical protein